MTNVVSYLLWFLTAYCAFRTITSAGGNEVNEEWGKVNAIRGVANAILTMAFGLMAVLYGIKFYP
jgi:hypothetical protein